MAKKEEDKAVHLISELYRYYLAVPQAMSEEYRQMIRWGRMEVSQAVVDYISGMTDQYALEKFREAFIPTGWGIY